MTRSFLKEFNKCVGNHAKGFQKTNGLFKENPRIFPRVSPFFPKSVLWKWQWGSLIKGEGVKYEGEKKWEGIKGVRKNTRAPGYNGDTSSFGIKKKKREEKETTKICFLTIYIKVIFFFL